MALAIKHAIIKRDVSHLTFPDEVQEIPAEEYEKAKTPRGQDNPNADCTSSRDVR